MCDTVAIEHSYKLNFVPRRFMDNTDGDSLRRERKNSAVQTMSDMPLTHRDLPNTERSR
jgi:hypothetical protein